MADFLNVLGLREATDEGRVGLGEDLVVNVADILRRQNAGYAVFSGLLENEFDEVFRRRIAWMRWEVRGNFVHEEQEFQLPVSRLLRQHPIVQFPGKFLNEILLLIFVLNGVQVHDVERDFSGNCGFDERIDVCLLYTSDAADE